MKNNIFEYLLDKQLCFAVMVSYATVRDVSIDMREKEYSIIINKVDKRDLDGKKMFNDFIDEQGIMNDKILIRELDNKEIGIFKEMNNLFEKVFHHRFGIIYELKTKSFLKDYKAIYKLK